MLAFKSLIAKLIFAVHISWKSPIYFLHYGKATAPPALCIHSVISLAWLGTLNKNKFAVYSGDSASVFIVMRLRELLFISYLGCLAFYFKQISTTEHLLIEFQPLQFKLNNFIAIIIRSQLFFSIFTHVTTFMFCPRLRAESHHTSDVGPRSSVRDHILGVERGERRGEASRTGGFSISIWAGEHGQRPAETIIQTGSDFSVVWDPNWL